MKKEEIGFSFKTASVDSVASADATAVNAVTASAKSTNNSILEDSSDDFYGSSTTISMSNDSATAVDQEPNSGMSKTANPDTESNTMETNTSTTNATNATSTKSSSDESEQISSTDTRRRVKLYMLNANRTWDDRGTGHVSSSYIDRLNGMSLLVKAETDGSTLLESRILADTAYQKQQDTLIVWSEGDNYDLALSFQERVGCEEIWEKICKVQGKDPSVDITQDLIEDDDNGM